MIGRLVLALILAAVSFGAFLVAATAVVMRWTGAGAPPVTTMVWVHVIGIAALVASWAVNRPRVRRVRWMRR